MNPIELESLPTSDLAALIAKAGAILAKRAGDQRPAQMLLLPELEPLDPANVDLSETFGDPPRRRWMAVKEAAGIAPVSEDTLLRRIKNDGIGVKVGGKYYIDATQIVGRA